jgi:prephenate dehydrogenase
MTPLDHDQAVAMTSHATHMIAAALAAATPAHALPLAASGWRDTTRIAAGDPQLWLQILLTNRQEVLKSLGKFEKVLAMFRTALARGDATRLMQLLDAGKQTRDSVGS